MSVHINTLLKGDKKKNRSYLPSLVKIYYIKWFIYTSMQKNHFPETVEAVHSNFLSSPVSDHWYQNITYFMNVI